MSMGIFQQLDWLTKQVKRLCCIIENGGGGGGSDITVQDEGSTLTTALTLLNFTGEGVTATNVGSVVTVDIPGGGGVNRSISTISTSDNAGSAADTDYVYFVTGLTTLTLPTAVGNTNLYTIKRIGTDVVTIGAQGGEFIDGSGSIPLNVQYQAVTLISDGINWNVI